MTDHKTGTCEEWLTARLELLQAEKELTRRADELTRLRQQLPWYRIDKDYRFYTDRGTASTDRGTASLADLFEGCSQLLVYHFMLSPGYPAGCPPRLPRRHAVRGVAGPAGQDPGVQARRTCSARGDFDHRIQSQLI